ncbi:mitochondrial fission ELM1 family protein [Methylobacterium platani]|uniref:Nucleoside-diphosphate sugar epimerase n=2 Tax=Methylobacterium platani TaxID=427683 RepID=A0A179SHT7_9HYPH|nr:mitochondrial fission ELM1 family protein [Methylobacterium platani]KMO17048.1 nucleoside-diphosphate sugar epimerase [Methylobacterium platani JCM 14648]OAS26540.1 nucleoside-diphosphate sugar epimerase [Methylobacterium platani]
MASSSPLLPAGTTAWLITDGKAGDLAPCRGLAEALGIVAEERTIAPRPPFSWLAPRGPADPRERALAPPWPDLAVATGRRAVPALRAVKRRSGSRTFTVFLRDPRIGTRAADLIWVPAHDRLRGPNVIVTGTGPHPVSPARLEAARRAPDPRLSALPHPRAAVLVGGDSRHGRFPDEDGRRLLAGLERLSGEACLMITASRRTPAALRTALADLARQSGGFFWDGSGENPYLALLALADTIVATADSANMVTEACAAGVPVLLFEPGNLYPRHRPLFEALKAHGTVHAFDGRVEALRPKPLDMTLAIAQAVANAYIGHRDALARRTAR